ncbi:Dynein alpha chain, flagellar outer arm [Dirofilaria immitis]
MDMTSKRQTTPSLSIQLGCCHSQHWHTMRMPQSSTVRQKYGERTHILLPLLRCGRHVLDVLSPLGLNKLATTFYVVLPINLLSVFYLQK